MQCELHRLATMCEWGRIIEAGPKRAKRSSVVTGESRQENSESDATHNDAQLWK